jgi:P27 family predicted phage terminase small subunit
MLRVQTAPEPERHAVSSQHFSREGLDMSAHRKSAFRKALAGTTRRDRQPRKEISARLRTAPRPPKGLAAPVATEWKRLAPAVIGLGTLTGSDLHAFEMLAATLATVRLAEQTIAAEGLTVATADGGRKPHPAVRVMEAARGQAARLFTEFGLTPKARQSLDIRPPAPALPALIDDDPAGSLDDYLASNPDLATTRRR